jgi:hypothetical protein
MAFNRESQMISKSTRAKIEGQIETAEGLIETLHRLNVETWETRKVFNVLDILRLADTTTSEIKDNFDSLENHLVIMVHGWKRQIREDDASSISEIIAPALQGDDASEL